MSQPQNTRAAATVAVSNAPELEEESGALEGFETLVTNVGRLSLMLVLGLIFAKTILLMLMQGGYNTIVTVIMIIWAVRFLLEGSEALLELNRRAASYHVYAFLSAATMILVAISAGKAAWRADRPEDVLNVLPTVVRAVTEFDPPASDTAPILRDTMAG